MEQTNDIPQPIESTPIATTGDNLREAVAAQFMAIGQQIDTVEANEKAPHLFALRQAEYALAQIDAPDKDLLEVWGESFTAGQIRDMLMAEHEPRRAAAQAEIERIEAAATAQRTKLTVVSDDIAASSPDELLALVTRDKTVTPASVRAGLGAWVAAQIQQERDAIEAAHRLHESNIGVFSGLGLSLNDLSNDEIIEMLTIKE